MTNDAAPAHVVWRRSDRLAQVASPGGGRYAILPLEAAGPVILTGTAAAIWEAIDGESTVAEVAGELARRYGADAEAVLGETLAFLAGLEEQGLVARMS